VFVLLVISHKRNVRPQGALSEGLGWPWNTAVFNDLYRHLQTQELHFQLLKIGKATLCNEERKKMLSRVVTILILVGMATSLDTGRRKNSKPDNAGIIAPAFFMMLKNEDLFEDDLDRVEESTVVTQTSYSNRQPLLHSHAFSSYRFMYLSGRVPGTILREAKENED
jgi:hypothetical protein